MTNKFEIVEKDEDAEQATILMCARLTTPLMLPNNEIGLCNRCGEAIQFRPHVPKTPEKVCVDCMLPEANEAARRGELNVMISPTTAVEIAAFERSKKAN